MNVYELSRDQLDELKSAYFWSENPGPMFDALGRPCLFPGDIPDNVIFREYDGISFTDDDFCCTAWGGAVDRSDECHGCEYLDRCRSGERPPCPWTIETVIFNPNLK